MLRIPSKCISSQRSDCQSMQHDFGTMKVLVGHAPLGTCLLLYNELDQLAYVLSPQHFHC